MELAPGVYGFFPSKQESGLTTYGITLEQCPYEMVEDYLEDISRYQLLFDNIDIHKSSLRRIIILRYYRDLQEVTNAHR